VLIKRAARWPTETLILPWRCREAILDALIALVIHLIHFLLLFIRAFATSKRVRLRAAYTVDRKKSECHVEVTFWLIESLDLQRAVEN
jgi:hypothetical protein